MLMKKRCEIFLKRLLRWDNEEFKVLVSDVDDDTIK